MTAVNLNRAVRGPVTAVPVVAGHGVRIVPDTVNNRFVVEADETVLWEYADSDNAYDSSRKSVSFSESCRNFEIIRVFVINNDGARDIVDFEPGDNSHTQTLQVNTISTEPALYVKMTTWVLSDNALTYRAGAQYSVFNGQTGLSSPTVNTTINYAVPYKVIGINRISST